MAAAHAIIGGGGGGPSSWQDTPIGELVPGSNPFAPGTAGKSKARHSLASFFLGTLLGNFLTLVTFGLSLVALGMLAWVGAGCGEYSCEDYPTETEDGDPFYWSAWWLAWGIFFDPGTQTGINAMEGASQKWVVVVFSILGFILNLIFLGLIVENIRVMLDSWRRTYGRIIANDHTVVLGWTDKTLFLLGELAEMMTDSQRGGGTIVVLGELDTLEMRMEVSIAFPDWQKRWSKVRVRYYNGKPYEVDDLLKVAVYAAERVIVLGCSRRPRVADSQMLTTICALRCLPGARFLTPATNVIAELKQPQNEPVVLHIGGDAETEKAGQAAEGGEGDGGHPLSILPVVGNHAANAIMGLCALDPSAGLALLDLMNFSGDQIETIPCANFTQISNTTFGALRNSFNAATPLGLKVRGKDGGEVIVLAPSDEHVIDSDTYLLVIAEDIAAALASSKHAAQAAQPSPKKPQSLRSPGKIIRAAGRFMRAGIAKSLTSQVGVDPSSALDEVSSVGRMKDGAEGAASKRCLIFIGWQRGFESFLRILDGRLPPNSEVHILSEQTPANRSLELASEGLALDGAAIQPKAGEEDDPSIPREVGLANCTLYHVYGYTTDERAMRRLPLARADAAVVVADANEDDVEALGGAELQIADSEALTSTVLLRRLRVEIEKDYPQAPPLTVVTEFVDLLTRRLLERQGSLITSAPKPQRAITSKNSLVRSGRSGRILPPDAEPVADPAAAVGQPLAVETADRVPPLNTSSGPAAAESRSDGSKVQTVVFHRNYIETTALSLASHSNTSWVTVQMLLDPFSGYLIQSVPCDQVIDLESPLSSARGAVTDGKEDPGCCLSFSDLSDALVTQRRGLLIGWRRKRGEVVINPPEKVKAFKWDVEDELIVLRTTKQ